MSAIHKIKNYPSGQFYGKKEQIIIFDDAEITTKGPSVKDARTLKGGRGPVTMQAKVDSGGRFAENWQKCADILYV